MKENHPNVILLLSDDQGYGDLGCHGNPTVKTPCLDALHAESVRFTDFHAAPMCTPTRGQLMSGLDALRNRAVWVGAGRTFMRRGIPTMAEVFGANGYRTGIFGKWHLGENYPYRPEDRGFEETLYFNSMEIGSAADYWDNDYFDDHYRHNGAMQQYEGYCTDVFFDEAMRWMLRCHKDDQPFFAYVPTGSDHVPLFVPDHYRDPYRHLGPYLSSYFGMIANQDENVGRLDQFLRKSGLWDNTIVLFMSDNGGTIGAEHFNSGMRGLKGSLYEGGHRVPCFVRWPVGSLVAGDRNEPAQVQDILPTLIDLCHLSPAKPLKCDGHSLAGPLRDSSAHLPERMLVVQNNTPRKFNAAVISKHYRLVKREELYNIADDPGQQHNIAGLHPDVVRAMRQHYEHWWSGLGDDLLEYERIYLDPQRENPACLSHLDSDRTNGVNGQSQVRGLETVQGPVSPPSGTWRLHVVQEGVYEFGLARWPIEAKTPLSVGMEPPKRADTTFDVLPRPQAGEFNYPVNAWVSGMCCSGKPLPIRRARLRVGEDDLHVAVETQETQAKFHVHLYPGPVEVRTMFYDADGKELGGAFYVYVTLLPTKPGQLPNS